MRPINCWSHSLQAKWTWSLDLTEHTVVIKHKVNQTHEFLINAAKIKCLSLESWAANDLTWQQDWTPVVFFTCFSWSIKANKDKLVVWNQRHLISCCLKRHEQLEVKGQISGAPFRRGVYLPVKSRWLQSQARYAPLLMNTTWGELKVEFFMAQVWWSVFSDLTNMSLMFIQQ